MSEKITFSMSFQHAIMRLALEDESFYLKASKFFEFNPFESEILWFYFKLIDNHYKEYRKLPGKVVLHTETKKIGEDKLEQYTTILSKILTADISDVDYLKRGLEAFVKQVRFKVAYDEVFDVFNDKSPDDAYKLINQTMSSINMVRFEDDEKYTPSDIIDILNQQTVEVAKKVKTGIHALDDASNGGPGAGEVFTVLARDGVGKSMFLMNVGAIAMMEGKKVLHIHCEGKVTQPLMRYCSRVCQIKYSDIMTNRLTAEDLKKVHKFRDEHKNNLIIKPFLGIDRSFGGTNVTNTIQDVIGYCSDLKKTFDFDVIIIDYGDKLDTKNKTEAKRFVYQEVWQGMEAMAKEFSVPVFTASQSQRIRGEGSKPLKKENMAEAIDKSRLSAFCMSINRSASEVTNEKIRFYVDKVRDGKKNIYVVCDSNFDMCTTHILENQTVEGREESDYEDASESYGR